MKTTHEILVASKGYLLNVGWERSHRGYGKYGAPQCTLGAVSAVGRRAGIKYREAQHVLSALVRDLFGHAEVPEWNDERGRTFDEVIALFDAAILQTAPKDTPAPQPETPSPSVTHVFA